MQEDEKEKVFMLEEKNKALAKQFFLTKEENKQLMIENQRHCDQISGLQRNCDSYQTIIQTIYSRITNIIKLSQEKLGVSVSEDDCSDILSLFGTDVMDDNDIRSLLSVTIPTHELKQVDLKPPTIEEGMSALLQRLSQLELLIQGDKSSNEMSISPKLTFKSDILRSAITSAYKRIQLLLEEIKGFQAQIKLLQRAIASSNSEEKEEKKEEKKPVSVSVPSATVWKEVEKKVENQENQAEVEQLKLEIRKLEELVNSRSEELESAEKEIAQLEKDIQNYRSQYYDNLSNTTQNYKEREYELEGLRKEVSELQGINEMEMSRQKALRKEVESVLGMVESQLTENKKQMEEERQKYLSEIEVMKQNETKILSEKEAFEVKLKRRKLFSELFQTLEEIVHKLYKIIKQNKDSNPNADSNSVIAVLKEQLSQMSESYKSYESVIHKTKKLVEFGDKKNDQLSQELLELKRTIENQKLMLEKERREKEELAQSKQLLEEENQIIREQNRSYEENCAKYNQELKLIKEEITTVITTEDNYEKLWKTEHELNTKLKEEIGNMKSEIKNSRASLKRSRSDFEKRLMMTKTVENREILNLVHDEISRYKNQLMCSLCMSRPKDCILKQCNHIFCRQCIQDRYDRRERTCPRCTKKYGDADIQQIWIIENDLYEELKDEYCVCL